MTLPYSNLRIEHMNPGASMPLILPVHVVCNTSDDQIFQNIHANSRRDSPWLKLAEEHDGIAVLCGSGPSIAEHISDIWLLRMSGAKIFALNGAAKYLYDNGILADYQVIIDARDETAQLVGPAKLHLFASQVSKKCFEKRPQAKVWHLQVDGMEEYLPEYNDDYCMIVGSASVGNTATCLAYAMGFRDLKLFGYDSSNAPSNTEFGRSHVVHQKINDGEPMASVHFNGNDYLCSLTMKLQAERFQITAKELQSLGCKIDVRGYGLLPDMFHAPKEVLAEHEKYEKMWKLPQYRMVSPGEEVAELIVELLNPSSYDVVIDFGCGTGRCSDKVHQLTGATMRMFDFVDGSLDSHINLSSKLRFEKHNLECSFDFSAKFGICTDVMEHIPPDSVEKVLSNIMGCAEKVFFQISFIPDHCGALIGHALHLSVHDMKWWAERFESMGYLISYKKGDENSGVFVVENKGELK